MFKVPSVHLRLSQAQVEVRSTRRCCTNHACLAVSAVEVAKLERVDAHAGLVPASRWGGEAGGAGGGGGQHLGR